MSRNGSSRGKTGKSQSIKIEITFDEKGFAEANVDKLLKDLPVDRLKPAALALKLAVKKINRAWLDRASALIRKQLREEEDRLADEA